MSDIILLVDDDRQARRHLRTIIEQSVYGDRPILECDTGEEGLSLVRLEHPCLVFFDPSLPGIQGSDFIRHLIRIAPDSPAVLVSQLQMFDVIYEAINMGCRGYLLKPVQRSEVLDVLGRLIVQALRDRRPGGWTDVEKPIQNAVGYLHEHFAEPLTLGDVAAAVSLSPSHFSRLFKLELGVTFVEYLNGLRIQHAKQLLRMTDLPVELVAEETGFRSAGYFSTLFRRVESLTPSAYRRRVRRPLQRKSIKK